MPTSAVRMASHYPWYASAAVGCLGALLVWVAPVAAGAQPMPSPAAATSVSAQEVLGAFGTAWAAVTSYTATVTVMERKDTQVQNIVLECTFGKPSNVTVHVDAGTNAGVTMVWDVTLMSTDPASNAGLTREIVELSTNTHLPVRILGYDGATLVRLIDFSNVKLNG